MLRNLIIEKAGLEWVEQIIIYDTDGMVSEVFSADHFCFDSHTLHIIHTAEELRYIYERDFRSSEAKAVLILPNRDVPVPYDISRRFPTVILGLETLFPQLDAGTLRCARNIDFDYLAIAATHLVGKKLNAKQTRAFCMTDMFSQAIVDEYAQASMQAIRTHLDVVKTYHDWRLVIDLLSKLMLLRDKGFNVDYQSTYDAVDSSFRSWTKAHYAGLASTADIEQPVMLHHIPDFIRRHSSKPAVIVIDGMNYVDWQIIREHFADAPWRVKATSAFSFLPSVTSIARQSLFSGKIPAQNAKAFSLIDEEKQWRQYWSENGLRDDEVYFAKTDTPIIPGKAKVVGIVVNFVDDLMHRQLQGTQGMAVDIKIWLQSGVLCNMIENLMTAGFDVYLTADHGHTEAIGKGRFTKPGLLTEDASRRAVIYKDFAGAEELDKFNVFEYVGTYMPKTYRYFLFSNGECIGDHDSQYITHGSDSIEELLVPFVRIGETHNG